MRDTLCVQTHTPTKCLFCARTGAGPLLPHSRGISAAAVPASGGVIFHFGETTDPWSAIVPRDVHPLLSHTLPRTGPASRSSKAPPPKHAYVAARYCGAGLPFALAGRDLLPADGAVGGVDTAAPAPLLLCRYGGEGTRGEAAVFVSSAILRCVLPDDADTRAESAVSLSGDGGMTWRPASGRATLGCVDTAQLS